MRERLNIEGIKKPVADLYPVVEGLRCVELQIPDDDGYLWILAGFVAILGKSWAWRGTPEDRFARALLWQIAYAATEWTQCMNCEQLQECLQPLFDALRAQVNQDAVFREFGTENAVGVPLPEEVITAPLAPGSNPTCNLDILWSQCEQLVDYSNTMITDVLEQLETATNNIELAQVITSLPILDELGADAIAGYIELLVDGIAENYAAEYDLSYRNTLACEIFCLASENCEITIELVYDVLFARVVAHFGSPGEALSQIGNLLSYLLDQDIEGDVIVDSLMFLLWGSSKLINSFLQDVGTSALETVLNLAVNDANDDWSTLCDCGWYSSMDLTSDVFAWEVNPAGKNWLNWVDTVGVESGFDTSEGAAYQMVQMKVVFASPAQVRRIAFDFDMTNGTQTPGLALAVQTTNALSGEATPAPDGTGQTFDREIFDDDADEISIRCQAGFLNPGSTDPGGSCTVIAVRVWGLGTKPAELP